VHQRDGARPSLQHRPLNQLHLKGGSPCCKTYSCVQGATHRVDRENVQPAIAHLSFDALELPGHPGLTLTAYSAEPGTPSADNLALLASWAASTVETAPAETSANDH
jgi:hypothetical protein